VRLARLQAVVSLFQALGGGWAPSTPAQAQAQVRAG
jgi:outer membrane protein TolC